MRQGLRKAHFMRRLRFETQRQSHGHLPPLSSTARPTGSMDNAQRSPPSARISWDAGGYFAIYSGFHSGEVRCEHPPCPPWQGWVQPETHPARRWGVGLSNGVSHSMENRYSSACPGKWSPDCHHSQHDRGSIGATQRPRLIGKAGVEFSAPLRIKTASLLLCVKKWLLKPRSPWLNNS
jgi:hypothetical protein